ncbi:MAG: hypothetical protein GY804_05175 [Alphaproteobacteria bacterium]|nr:hypothetical protein [Alphaproteobacteria bacterium]
MINDFFIDCELWSRTQTTDPMGGKIWTYAKTSDIKGIMYPKKTKALIEGVWKYVEQSVFMTVDVVGKDHRVNYKNQLYQVSGTPSDIMEMSHHYEIDMELIDNV